MPDDIYQKQAEKLEAENKSLASEVKELKDQLAKADISKYESRIEALEQEKSEAQEDAKSKSDELSTANDKIKELSDQIEKANKEKAELQSKLDEVEAERQVERRVIALTDVGVEKADAIKIVEKYAEVDESIFADVVDTQKQLVEARMDKEMDEKKKKKEKAEKTVRVEAEDEDEEVQADLDEAETEDKPDLSIAAQLNSKEDGIAELRKAIASRLNDSHLVKKYMTESK